MTVSRPYQSGSSMEVIFEDSQAQMKSIILSVRRVLACSLHQSLYGDLVPHPVKARLFLCAKPEETFLQPGSDLHPIQSAAVNQPLILFLQRFPGTTPARTCPRSRTAGRPRPTSPWCEEPGSPTSATPVTTWWGGRP